MNDNNDKYCYAVYNGSRRRSREMDPEDSADSMKLRNDCFGSSHITLTRSGLDHL